MTLYGMRIHVSPLIVDPPRFELSPRLQEILNYGATPGYVQGFNDWSRKFFGTNYEVIKAGDDLFMSEAGYHALRLKLEKEGKWLPPST
jgi:hypothetical protein